MVAIRPLLAATMMYIVLVVMSVATIQQYYTISITDKHEN